MRDIFPEFYTPTNDEFDKLWQEALVVVDANVLLSLFRHQKKVVSEIIGLLNVLRDRLWLPRQVGLEFHRNRHSVIFSLEKPYNRIDELISKLSANFSADIKKLSSEFRYHPTLDFKKLLESVQHFVSSVTEYTAGTQKELPGEADVEALLQQIAALFDGRVGDGIQDKSRLIKDARERFKNKIPPGYMDVDKPDAEAIGDFIIWEEMIAHATKEKRPIIFITDDAKEDWIQRVSGRTIGPRPELIREFRDRTSQAFYLYNLPHFLEQARGRKIGEVSAETVRDAEVVSTAQAGQAQAPSRAAELTRELKSVDEFLRNHEMQRVQALQKFKSLGKQIEIMPDFGGGVHAHPRRTYWDDLRRSYEETEEELEYLTKLVVDASHERANLAFELQRLTGSDVP
ncbi:PIN-like domain-containing protein [Methylorubrum extorquens]